MKLVMVVILGVLVSACANKPWSVIDGSMSRATDSQNYDVYITGVDGKLYFDNMKIRNVDSGFRLLQLTTSKPDRKGRYTYTSFPIITKPCVRYFVSAQHESNLTYENKRWAVLVLREEPIESCLKTLKNKQ
ncbi:MAG: hypothetical protein HWE27_06835 [Gammaproteobacteria bacterium]|nr:hypothetical protein [Gammaproteobacteria bacterium]